MSSFDGVAEHVKEAIGRVRARIDTHGSDYAQSAVATCYQLVLPVLRAFGCDVDDPAAATITTPSSSDRVRITLRNDGAGSVLAEVYALGVSQMDRPSRGRIDDYLMAADEPDAAVVAFTDGDTWVVHRRHDGWRSESNRIALNENFEMGYWLHPRLQATPVSSNEVGDDRQDPPKPPPPPPPSEWVPLSDDLPRDVKPTRIRFVDGVEVSVTTLSGAYADIGRYLVRADILTADDLPLGITRSVERIVFNSIPRHMNGKQFYLPVEMIHGIWMDSFIALRDFVQYLMRLFKKLNADTSAVEFKFGGTSGTEADRTTETGQSPVVGMEYPIDQLIDVEVAGTKPLAVVTHRGVTLMASGWSDVFEKTVRDLVADGQVTKASLPISLANNRGKRIAHTVPYHRDASRFRSPIEVADEMFFESAGSAKQIVQWLECILEEAHVPADSVKIQFAGEIDGRYRRRRRRRNDTESSETQVTRWYKISRDLDVSRSLGQIQIGSNVRMPLGTWRDLYHVVANHLVDTGQITRLPIPIGVTDAGRCAINRSPTHPNGSPFRTPRELDGGLWLEVGVGKAQILSNTVSLLEIFDYPMENIGVSFADESLAS